MNTERELDEIVQDVLSRHKGIFLVEAIHRNKSHEYILDGDKPLGIYDVADVSREINKLADEKMPEENYSLEIGSPGADSPLKQIRQYPKHAGREFSVMLTDDTTFTGKLLRVEDDTLTFETFASARPKKNETPAERSVRFGDIKKANIILSFK